MNCVNVNTPAHAGAPRLLDHACERIRVKHYSIGTETQYVNWVDARVKSRFIALHQMVLCASRGYLIAGGSPAAVYLSCFAKKGKPKKATPIHRPFGGPYAARQAGRLRNSRLRAQTVLADGPRLACAARRWTEGNQHQTHPHPGPPLEGEGVPSLATFHRSRWRTFRSTERGITTRFPSAPLRVDRQIGGCRLRPVRVPRQLAFCASC